MGWQGPIIWKPILFSFNSIGEKLNQDLFFDEMNQLKIFLNKKICLNES